MTRPKLMRIAGWMFWQLLWLAFALLIYANLFSEYGAFGGNRVVHLVVGAALVGIAVWIGTWLPIRSNRS